MGEGGWGRAACNEQGCSFKFQCQPLKEKGQQHSFSSRQISSQYSLCQLTESLLISSSGIRNANHPVHRRRNNERNMRGSNRTQTFKHSRTLRATNHITCPLLIMSSNERKRNGRQRRLILFEFPLLCPRLHQFMRA